MVTKAEFSDEQWATLRRAPMVAGMAISIADPGGPIEATKETLATLRTLTDPASAGADSELTKAVAADVEALAKERKSPLGDFKPKSGALAGQQILEELQKATAIVTAKATPEEAEAFRKWIVATAQAAADAAKEGGFMGFGAERVSEGERTMLEKVAEAVGARAPG
jgi:hypothetical protein